MSARIRIGMKLLLVFALIGLLVTLATRNVDFVYTGF